MGIEICLVTNVTKWIHLINEIRGKLIILKCE